MTWNFVNGSQPLDTWLLVIDDQKRKWIAKFVHIERLKEYWWEVQNDNDNCCSCINPDFSKTPPTHWMLLPQDPQEEPVKEDMRWSTSMKTTQPTITLESKQ